MNISGYTTGREEIKGRLASSRLMNNEKRTILDKVCNRTKQRRKSLSLCWSGNGNVNFKDGRLSTSSIKSVQLGYIFLVIVFALIQEGCFMCIDIQT